MRKFVLLIMIVLSAGALALAQNKRISGTVKGVDGKPIAGATVLVEGTSIGTTTNAEGRFSVQAPADGTLVVSFIGYASKSVNIAGKTRLDIALKEDTHAIDDVIVVAYGTAKKESFTGSVAVVKGEELEHRKVSNVTKALDGLAPGVQVTSGSGQPGSGTTVAIRGFGSINASSTPLYVVDGIPYDGVISAINPDDIASISILKDASASVLYGARGANGVVLINTKKGNRNETNVELKINVGVSSRAIPRYETVGARDFMEIMYSAFYNDYGSNAVAQMASGSKRIFGSNEMYNPYDVPLAQLFTADGKVRDDAKLLWDEDWLDEVTDNAALRQEYGASVSGGNEKTQYMFSLGYLNEDGVLKTTNFERYSGRLNVETQAKPWFAAGMGANFARNSTNSSQTSASATSNVFFSAQMMAPIYPVYQRDPETGDYLRDANGRKQFDYGSSRPSGQQTNFNSIATLYDDKYAQTSYSLSARAHMDFMGISDHWSEGLKFQLNFGTDYYNSQSMTYYNPFFGNAESVGGRIQKTNTTSLGYTFNQLLSYNRTFDRHNIDLLLGHEYYAYTTSDLSGHKTGLPGGGIYELDAAAVIVGTGSSTDEDRIESVFSRIGYSYDDKYYLSGSWRTDGSSRFARSTRWGNFWSVGASWRMSQEAFMRDISWLNNLTLKFSYGVQGNNSVGSYYAYQALYDTGSPNATLPGATINDVANEDLTWESNHNLNVGLEARLLDRIDLSFEFYNRKTTDMLLSYPLASSSGFDSYYRNSGEMRNRGIEFAVTGRIFDRRDFQWSVTWMGSTVSNKVLKLTEDGKDIIGSTQIIREGETLYSYYVARSAGVDPMTGEKMYWATDKDGNDYITKSTTVAQANRVIAGSRIPDLYGSLSTSLRWKNLDFSISTNYSIGGKNYDGVYYEFMSCYYTAQAKHKDMLRAWRKPGDVTDVPKYTIGETPIVTDDKLVDASYFSIKNITLGYTLPRRWTSKIGFKAARVSASVDNLCIFTHLKGMDPQYSLTGGTSYAYAPTRTVSFNLDLKF
ncbi:SusC/RagA family TonB-linked outer membrane protein [Alistipes senegalensis]|uniref:SusC/RagA family TonB-linked outer membrane protein n=1 Tax=Alistipes senegalensis TaxID=1288121 RepID=UPI001E60CC59|nr:TonB-dependent receptor [Alistipes senegalensis]